jgi:hypothetical protein
VLCDAEVALIVFSSRGRLYEYANNRWYMCEMASISIFKFSISAHDAYIFNRTLCWKGCAYTYFIYMHICISWILHTTRQLFALSKLEQVRSHLSRGKTVGRVKWELHLLLRVTSFCYINCMLSCLLWCSWEEATRGKKLPQFLSAYFHSPAPVRQGEVS